MTYDVGIWMPIFVGDYLAKTQRLSTLQHGAYFLICLDYWRNGPPPDNDDVLSQITKLSIDEWRALRKSILAYFSVDGGKWRSEELDRKIREAKKNRATYSERGRKGAKVRWNKHREASASDNASTNGSSNASSDRNSMVEENPSPSPSPSPSPTTDQPPPKRNGPGELKSFGDLGEGIVDRARKQGNSLPD